MTFVGFFTATMAGGVIGEIIHQVLEALYAWQAPALGYKAALERWQIITLCMFAAVLIAAAVRAFQGAGE